MRRALPLIGSATSDVASSRTSVNAEASSGQARKQTVVLVGPVQQEPLALQYLRAAVKRAGHDAVIVPYSYRKDLNTAIERCLALAPDVIGVGIAFQNAIEDYIAFIREVRARGFTGHLTAGGHVPTFCYEELLRDLPELDTVVRHDGEETLVELCVRLSKGEPLRDIDGLVWRHHGSIATGNTRRANGDLDSLAPPERSETPYTVGGLVVDFLITARGCVGECNYCSIAAYTTEQRKRYRLRKPAAVAEEAAIQHHQRAASVFFVQDDLFVLPSEARSVERIEALDFELRQRGVNDVVFWVKGRPESITPKVCDALQRMGVIHLFLGVESANAERLEYLGRLHQPHHNETAIAACRAASIVPSFNFMLFDPDSDLDDLEATLQMAEKHADLPWNVCRTEVYSGTALRDRLAAEQRLQGDYRSYGYLIKDLRAEVLFRILRVSLHERALEIESLLNRLISVSFSRQLHERFFPGEHTQALANIAMNIGIEARLDTVRVIREAADFVRSADLNDKRAIQRFAVTQALAVNLADNERRRQTEEIWQHLHLRGDQLMRARGRAAPPRVQAGYGVAQGS